MTQWGLDNLFNPGKRHMDDEKRRLQSTREEIGDNSKGRRIDLEAGKVSITVRRPDAATTPEGDDVAVALDSALEAEEIPAVALANDEAEIVPEVVDQADELDSVGEGAAITAPESAPVAAETLRRRQVSANDWSRRG